MRSTGRCASRQGLAFLAVTVAGIGLAVAVLRGAGGAPATGAVLLLGGQLGAVIGTAWELTGAPPLARDEMLHELGFSPTAGLLINLVYSTPTG